MSGYIVEFSGFDGGSTVGIIANDTKSVTAPSVPTTTVTGASLSLDTGTSGVDFVTNFASQTISGTLSVALAAGEKVEVSYDDGGTWSDATCSTGSAAWSQATVLSGSSTFKARVSNIAGSSTAYSHTYIYDAAAPAAPSAPDLTAGSDTGSSGEDNYTGDTTPTFTGTAEPGSVVALYDTDGNTVLGTATASDGNWSITASILAPGAHTVTAKSIDAAGNMSAASTGLSITIDTTGAAVMSVSVPANDTYKTGDALNFTVSWDENVTVGTAGGTPRLALDIGGTTRYAAYLSGTDTSNLVFRYTVTSGDFDSNGITVSAAQLNGGTMRDAGGNDAALTLNSVGSTANVLVDAVAPSVTSVTVPANGTYAAGQSLDFTVNMSENVTVITTGGTPRIALVVGATTRYADYLSGTGTTALTFRYTVTSGDMDSNGITVGALSANGGTLRDAVSNNATLTLNSVGSTANVWVDAAAPAVTSVAVPANGTYAAGDSLSFTVSFGESVTVNTADGTPRISLTVGSATRYATYIGGSGTSALTFICMVALGDSDADGIAVVALDANGGTIKDAISNDATLTLNNVAVTTNVLVDAVAPDAPQAPDLAAASDTGVLDTDDITADTTPTFEGTAEANCTVTLYSDAAVIGTTTADGSGNWSFTAPLALTEGTHSITAAATDGAGNVSAASVGLSIAIDTTAPAAGGAVTVTRITKFRVSLTWPSGTDAKTDALALMYKVVYSTSDNITSVTNAELNGTTGIDWTAGITSATVSGLTPNTTYYVNVLVKDEAGNITAYAPITQMTASSSNDDSDGQDSAGAPVIVNGETKTAGTTRTATDDSGRTVTTVTVDTDRLEDILEAEDSGALVVIPFDEDADVAVGVLRGDMVAAMADREASLVIRAGSSTYTLPAVELDIEAIATQFGENVPLSAITVSVGISQPSDEMATVIRSAARDGGFTLVIPGVEFTVTCRYGGRTVEVGSFKAFVERTVAIPDGVDPSKITTGIVVEPDGTVRHVPTRITRIDGKYYAVIHSLTNSVYAVVWNPVEFADVTEHWAKDAINDMGSRMVVNGIDNSHFEPDRNMTRAEFAAIIVRALGLKPIDGANVFTDVADSQWYCGYIETAAAYGIITGYDDKTFGPSDLITREQAMTMISRAMQLTGLGADQSSDEMAALLAAFSDDASVSSYAKAGIAACLKTGIVSGTIEGTLAPKDTVTRAEVAVMVQRLLQKAGLI